MAEALRCKALSLPWQIQSFTHRELGYPGCSQVLVGWIDELAPVERKTAAARSFSVGKKQAGVEALETRGCTAEEAAEAAGSGPCLTVQVKAGAGMQKERRVGGRIRRRRHHDRGA